ncbi:hypothetical protein BKA70DRAFT_1402888 [Coprinopsis sp. MPI-PUGE-AT-0042]|nr:hypothetical protein BKA70DRAFT_1402888 [Coprinopsis sp. MPI-PUGE-AT-0042]
MTTVLELPRPAIYIGPTPLPPNEWNPSCQNADEVVWFAAYETCLSMEAGATGALDLMYARILGYLLLHVPLDTGRTCIAREILECQAGLPMLQNLAQHYQSLLQAFRQRASASTEPRDRYDYSLDELEKIFTGPLRVPAASHSAAKQAALRRDTFRCLVTSRHDSDYLEYCALSGRPIPDGPVIPNAAVHIIPPHLSEISQSDTTLKLKHFGVEYEELNGDSIHHLGNIMTMGNDMHGFFHDLLLWLEPDPLRCLSSNDQYFVAHAQVAAFLPESRRVTFVNGNSHVELELPKAKFLKAHGALCRIAHLSGVVELMNSYGRDLVYDNPETE